MSSTDYDPNALAELPGAIPLRALNIAPTEGEILVGHVPYGLTLVTGKNMAGKTRLLKAITAIPLKRLDPRLFTVTRGTRGAAVSLGAAELRVEEVERGGELKRRVRREGVAVEGAISEMPDPIEELITAKHRIGEEPAWRARMAALNAFHPVEVSEEKLEALAGPPLEAPDQDLAVWVVNAHAEDQFNDLLVAADGLRKELRRRAVEAEEDLSDAQSDVDRVAGALSVIANVAKELLGLEGEALEAQLLAVLDLDALRQRKSEADRRLARLEAQVEERTGLAGTMGEEPDVAAAEKAVAEAEAAHTAAREERDRIGTQLTRREVDEGHQRNAYLAEQQRVVDRLRQQLAEAEEALDNAAATFEEEWKGDTERVRSQAQEASSVTVDKGLLRERAEQYLREVRDARDRWRSQQALVEGGPTVEDVQTAQAAAAAAATAVRVGEHAAEYQRVHRQKKEIRSRMDAAKDRMNRLEAEQLEVWRRLGELMTTEIGSDVVRVVMPEIPEEERDTKKLPLPRIEVLDDSGRWIDVGDNVELSEGRLRRLFLDFWLERSEAGQNVHVPDRVIYFIDQAGRAEVSRRAAAKRMRLISEEHQEHPSLQVKFYAPAEPRDGAA